MRKKLFDSNASMYLLSYLMSDPAILRNAKYLLTLNDFTKPVHKIVFSAINNLAADGANQIHSQDVDMYLVQYKSQYEIYQKEDGFKFLKNLEELGLSKDEPQFATHYKRIKKFTVLRDLERMGMDTTDLYDPNVDYLKLKYEDDKLDAMSLNELIDKERSKIAHIEKRNINKEDEYFQQADQGLRALVESLKENPDIGVSMEGDMFNTIVKGARHGKFYLISAPQSHGKTRFLIGNACRMAMPRIENGKVVINAPLQKVMYIATEQLPEEIQTMILAYVSGVNEEKILYRMGLTKEDEKLIEQAEDIIDKYGSNLYIDMMSSPTIDQMRSRIVDQILNKQLDAVFYDYIFIPSEVENRRNFRNDQLLMLMGATLKDIATAYNVFVFSATQISGQWSGPKVRNQTMIRDAKSLADKTDIGCIVCQVDNEEYECVKTFFEGQNLDRPNVVIDLYKNRRGSVTNVKIWRKFDYGTCRAKDLLVTTQTYGLIEDIGTINYEEPKVVDLLDFLTEIREVKNDNV